MILQIIENNCKLILTTNIKNVFGHCQCLVIVTRDKRTASLLESFSVFMLTLSWPWYGHNYCFFLYCSKFYYELTFLFQVLFHLFWWCNLLSHHIYDLSDFIFNYQVQFICLVGHTNKNKYMKLYWNMAMLTIH